jgi:hypothetical protein
LSSSNQDGIPLRLGPKSQVSPWSYDAFSSISFDLTPDVCRKDGSLECIDKMLKLYLDSANLDCQLPMMGFLESLGGITYDIPTLLHAPVLNVNLVWSATRRILDWVQRQRQKVGFFHFYPEKRPLM